MDPAREGIMNATTSEPTNLTADTMLELRRSGMTNAQIAERLGCSRVRVWQLIGPQPKPEKPKRTKPAERPHIKANEEQMLALRRLGYGNVKIAEKVGCSKVRVYQLIGPQPKELRKKRESASS